MLSAEPSFVKEAARGTARSAIQTIQRPFKKNLYPVGCSHLQPGGYGMGIVARCQIAVYLHRTPFSWTNEKARRGFRQGGPYLKISQFKTSNAKELDSQSDRRNISYPTLPQSDLASANKIFTLPTFAPTAFSSPDPRHLYKIFGAPNVL